MCIYTYCHEDHACVVTFPDTVELYTIPSIDKCDPAEFRRLSCDDDIFKAKDMSEPIHWNFLLWMLNDHVEQSGARHFATSYLFLQ